MQACSRCSALLHFECEPLRSRPAAPGGIIASEVEAVSSTGALAKKPRTATHAAKGCTECSILVGEALLSRDDFAVLRRNLLSEALELIEAVREKTLHSSLLCTFLRLRAPEPQTLEILV